MTSEGQRRNAVTNYAGPRAFYDKDMRRKHRAAQDTPLPPRCSHCRLPGNIKLNGIPHCDQHVPCVDQSCGYADPPIIISPPSPWHGEGTTEPVAERKDGPMAYRGRVWRTIPTRVGEVVDSETEEVLCEHAHRKPEFARRCGERMAEQMNGSLT